MFKREDLNYLLQRCDLNTLKKLYEKIDTKYGVKVLLQPVQQTILVPVKDPISQGEFYGGELLVTTTITQLNDGTKGWAMVQDDQKNKSLYISAIDACFASGELIHDITELLQTAQEIIKDARQKNNQQVNATRVKFELM